MVCLKRRGENNWSRKRGIKQIAFQSSLVHGLLRTKLLQSRYVQEIGGCWRGGWDKQPEQLSERFEYPGFSDVQIKEKCFKVKLVLFSFS